MENHEVRELIRSGFTCSQIMVMMTMRQMDIEDEYLVRAVKGLTLGMGVGHACGIVTGAACALSLAHGLRGMSELFPMFYRYFFERYGETCESINCIDIRGGDLTPRLCVCAEMIEHSWDTLSLILAK